MSHTQSPAHGCSTNKRQNHNEVGLFSDLGGCVTLHHGKQIQINQQACLCQSLTQDHTTGDWGIIYPVCETYSRGRKERTRATARKRFLVTISQTACLNPCLISQGVMSNSAAPLAAILYLTHCHTLINEREREKKGKVCFLPPLNNILHSSDLPHIDQFVAKKCCCARVKFPLSGRIEWPIWQSASAIQDNVSSFLLWVSDWTDMSCISIFTKSNSSLRPYPPHLEAYGGEKGLN